MTGTPIVRRIHPEDVLGCIDTFYVALDDLYARFDQPPLPREPAALQRLIQHLIDTDGERCWLAEEPSTTADPSAPLVLGFGAAALREGAWFLSLLFVRPQAQKAGLGRRLLLETFPRGEERPASAPMVPGAVVREGADAPATGGAGSWGGRVPTPAGRAVLSTCVEALQPISTGLYASYGIVPRVPLFSAVGEPRPGAFPPLPPGIEALPFEEVAQSVLAPGLDGLDRAVLGYARPADHAFWREERRRGVLFRARGGELLGYGYTQASGRLGPVAVLDAELMTAVLGVLFTRESPRGAWLAVVPGTNEGAMVPFLRSGFRLEGWPGIVSSTGDVGFLARYLPASFALL